jgi:amino acid adenylation domain-containing protein
LLRAELVEIGSGKYLLLLDMHHIVSDGVSSAILVRDLVALYNKKELPELKLQYKDYAEWQQSEEKQQSLMKQRSFWMNEFSELPEPLPLPTDIPRPSKKNYTGALLDFEIGPQETMKLHSAARRTGSTMFMILLAGYAILLSKLTGEKDIVIGTPVAGREHADLENMIGMFVNTLALRVRPESGLTFDQFLLAVRTKTLLCFDNQDFQYEELVDQLKLERDMSHNPLFDIVFSYQNFDGISPEIQGLTISQYPLQQHISKFDITLAATESDGRLLLTFEYSSLLFNRATIEKFAVYFKNIIAVILDNGAVRIADIDMLTVAEKEQIRDEFNASRIFHPIKETVIEQFRDQVRKTPEHIAIIAGDKRLTYRQLNEASNKLGRYLSNRYNIGRNDLVGVMLNKSDELIVAVLAVLRSGAAYVPIDPDYPDDRIRLMVEGSGLKAIITSENFERKAVGGNVIIPSRLRNAIDKESGDDLTKDNDGDDLFYVIYTSGSTGLPKGAMIQQYAFSNLLDWYERVLSLSESDVVLLLAPISFDLAQKNIFAPLLTGATLCLPDCSPLEYQKIADTIFEQGVTVINVAPSSFYPLMETDINTRYIKLRSLRKVVLGGEPINTRRLSEWAGSDLCNAIFLNSYGPTECTDVVSWYQLDHIDLNGLRRIPIGRPIDNTFIYILDEDLNMCPTGVCGEIYIGGIGVSGGYLNDAMLTAEKFVKDPFRDQGLMYRTGDAAKWMADGNIDLTGRMDNQVKLRGFRIELGEIEDKLSEFDGVRDAVVVIKEKNGEQYLTAYFVANRKIAASEFRRYLAEKLPGYMIPSRYISLDQLPRTASGKTDRRALPDSDIHAVSGFVKPANEMQRELIKIWADVLDTPEEEIGINSNFFEIGGNSLKIISIANKVNSAFPVAISVAQLFQLPEIALLADFLSGTEEHREADPDDVENDPFRQRGEAMHLFGQLLNK